MAKTTTRKKSKLKAAAPGKVGRRGGRKPGQWVLLEKDALSRYRKEAKLSRAKVAKIVGASDTSIQNWETGRSVPTKKFQQKLVELMSGKPAAAPSPAGKPASQRASRSAKAPLSSGTGETGGFELQATRLSVTGEILKAYLATAQGAKMAPGGLVALVGQLRSALA